METLTESRARARPDYNNKGKIGALEAGLLEHAAKSVYQIELK